MATKAKSKNRKSRKAPVETDVILIVKGAGEQAEDDHLNIFLRGFWPAVKSLDKNATIKQVSVDESMSGSSPHNEDGKAHRHLTEIRAKLPDPKGAEGKYAPRRIWLRESYWENEVLPSSALGNLSKEWAMSSHVFANMFQDLIFTRDNLERKNILTGQTESKENLINKGETSAGNVYKEILKPSDLDFWASYLSFAFLFLLIFLPLAVAPFLEPGRMSGIITGIFPGLLLPTSLSQGEMNGILLAIVVALIWAAAPALELSRMIHLRYETQSNLHLKRSPGLPSWTLVLLIFLLLTFPLSYLVVLLVVLLFQVAFLFARRILWTYRYYSNSDVDRAKEYYDYKIMKNEEAKTLIGKVNENWLLRLLFSPLLYRYVIFLALPFGFLITSIAGFLKWTRVLGGLGEALDGAIKFMLVGYMDDVVNYANDPVQAHRVRSIVMEDIKRYHDLDEVKRIHVIAHSQGTPITFETLFHYLDTKYQSKIYTYVTLGSVLSYYHQARGTLDPLYYNRFKMPIRKDKFPGWNTPPEKPGVKPAKPPRYEFQWFNFWNFTDPITEFYGLDEYTWFDGTWKDEEEKIPRRGYTSPVNIRTGSSLAKHHGEYWDNLETFQKPFAKRVLGDFRPKEWMPDHKKRGWHHLAVFLLSPVILLLLAGFGFGIYLIGQYYLPGYLSAIYTIGANIFQQVFPPAAGGEQNMIQRVFAPETLGFLKDLWENILAGALVVLGIWAVVDWINQLFRAPEIEGVKGEKKNETSSKASRAK